MTIRPAEPQPVYEMLGADGRETQLDVPGKSPGPSDGVTKNGGDLRIRQFVTGYLEHHERDDSRTGEREQEGNKACPIPRRAIWLAHDKSYQFGRLTIHSNCAMVSRIGSIQCVSLVDADSVR